jgi:hypothetical protein
MATFGVPHPSILIPCLVELAEVDPFPSTNPLLLNDPILYCPQTRIVHPLTGQALMTF